MAVFTDLRGKTHKAEIVYAAHNVATVRVEGLGVFTGVSIVSEPGRPFTVVLEDEKQMEPVITKATDVMGNSDGAETQPKKQKKSPKEEPKEDPKEDKQ